MDCFASAVGPYTEEVSVDETYIRLEWSLGGSIPQCLLHQDACRKLVGVVFIHVHDPASVFESKALLSEA